MSFEGNLCSHMVCSCKICILFKLELYIPSFWLHRGHFTVILSPEPKKVGDPRCTYISTVGACRVFFDVNVLTKCAVLKHLYS